MARLHRLDDSIANPLVSVCGLWLNAQASRNVRAGNYNRAAAKLLHCNTILLANPGSPSPIQI